MSKSVDEKTSVFIYSSNSIEPGKKELSKQDKKTTAVMTSTSLLGGHTHVSNSTISCRTVPKPYNDDVSKLQGVLKPVKQSDEDSATIYKNQLANIKTVEGQSKYILDVIRSIRKSGVSVSFSFDSITQFSSREILDEDLPFLRRICPNIMDLDLSFNANISDVELADLTGWPLQKLNLAFTQVTDMGLAHFAGMPLQELNLAHTPVKDAGLAHLARLALRKLCLKKTLITDAGLPYLVKMPLQELDLSATRVTDAGLAHLAEMPLKRLYLAMNQITDAGLPYLVKMPLQELDLSCTEVTDAGLAHLAEMPLKRLYLAMNQITDAGLVHLTGLSLQELDVSCIQVTDAGVAQLAKVAKLKY
ncbi:MAG TPA: hypothetical protein VLG76_03875 [Rhabdochlamydiaceae bacterium]|nr:hypothetical protein [Rhabdochlamydiaceae bacterium]